MQIACLFFGLLLFGELKGGENVVKYVVFWKINPAISPETIAKVAASLMQSGAYPVKGSQVLGWYMCPGGKGVSILEHKGDEGDVAYRNWLLWAEKLPGIFTEFEIMPAVTALEAVQIVLSKEKK
ncbi:MAG: DUF3303 family protein [Methanomassiliicoccales archaeon]|nr:DUF3303 family protein [Methanomassiliicoccales archaeon]